MPDVQPHPSDGIKVVSASLTYYEIDCLDCSVCTYGGQDIYEIAVEHAQESGHRVQIVEKQTRIVTREDE